MTVTNRDNIEGGRVRRALHVYGIILTTTTIVIITITFIINEYHRLLFTR